MSLFEVYAKYNITLEHAKGSFLWDKNGNKYLDCYGGHGVISIGHNHPNYIRNLKNQLDKIGYYSNSVNHPLQNQLANELSEISQYPEHQLFMCNSGAEANDNALKLASFHTGKSKVIAFNNSFHGRTSGTLNVTDDSKISSPVYQNNFQVDFIPINDINAFEKAITQNVAAVIIEGIQGVGGITVPSDGFMKFLRESCTRNNVVLILDEIQSGFGRTGEFFAHQHSKIEADIVTMAKGMGNGFPVAGLLISPEIKAKQGMLGSTFGGNQLACTAALSVLQVIKTEKLLAHVISMEKHIRSFQFPKNVLEIKGKGLMLGFELSVPASPIRELLLLEHGIFTGGSRNPNQLRILPPLCISKTELDGFTKSLSTVFQNEELHIH